MPGAWLAKIGSWIARRETFEQMVAPAIADLQAEAASGFLNRCRHYMGIGVVLVHAMLQDLRFDAASAFDADARRVAWRRTALWYAGFVALMTFLGMRYNLPSRLPMDGLWSAALTSSGLEAIVTAASIGIVPAVLYLCRKSASRRAIVLIVLIVAALTSTFALAIRPVRISADRTLYNGIQARISTASASGYKRDDLDERIAWSKDLHSGVSVLPSALIGIVLARRRGWRVAWTVAGLFATWYLVVITWSRLGSHPAPLEMRYWKQIAIDSLVAVIWLMSDEVARRMKQRAVTPARRFS